MKFAENKCKWGLQMKKSRLGIRIMHWERKHTYEYAILHYVSIGFILSIGILHAQ